MFTLVPVNLSEDAELLRVMSWRNDPGTREYFFHPEPKVWPAYRDEFRGHYADAPAPPQFIHREDRACGFLGFRRYDVSRIAAVSVDILVAAPERGRGAASWALSRVPSLLERTSVDTAVAEVLSANAVSQRLFDHSPFKRLDRFEKHVPDTGQTHAVIRYIWKKS